MTKVSICIPTYNQVKYLRQTLDSVLNQTYVDYEIIITDDSSTNIVFDLIQEYRENNKIKYYKNEVTLGSPENWNESIRKASGEYIKIMHHDDYFTTNNSLIEFVEMLDENPNSDFAFSAAVAVNIENNKTWLHCPSNRQIENLYEDPKILFFGNFIGPPSSVIYRRNTNLTYDKKLKWVVDFDFYIRILYNNNSFVFSKTPLITSISGELHNVTRLCKNDKNVEIQEYLYLFYKMSLTDKYIVFEKKYFKFFMNLFAKYKIKSIKEVRETGYCLKIPLIFKFIIIINRFKIILRKMKGKLTLKRMFIGNEKYDKISYSQCGEDLIVKFIFDNLGIKKPNYLDIGAHHPYYISNTALFYQNGCRGINIEPDPILFEAFIKEREEDVNINIGIGDKYEELNFYVMSSPTLNTFSKEEAYNYQKEGNYTVKSIEKIKVNTLSNILKEFSKGIFPQFLSVDAEGIDEIIIKDIDFEKNYPIVICIETISFSTSGNGLKNKNLIQYIEENGYLLYADTYINSIFVKESFWRRNNSNNGIN